MTVRSYGWRDRMKIRSSLIFVSLILLVSCSKVNIENENNDMISRLREKKESTEKLRIEKEPWTVNTFANLAGLVMLDDKEYIEKSEKWILEEKKFIK